MANKKSREIADGAPDTPEIIDNLADITVNESELEAETDELSDHGPPAGYEQLREQRIKENLERMQKLGIADLSLKLKSTISASSLKRVPRNFFSHRKTPLRSPLLVTEPPRRSSRLQNATPISYAMEVKLPKQERKRRREPLLLKLVGARPEIYTEEHEKLLGSTESTWKLFVDGYGADGRRIYDSVRGKSCHQCRQKTLGHRTECSKCQMVRGQFCGDYMVNMFWKQKKIQTGSAPPVAGFVIVVCAGKQMDGLQPISSMGYKSVAHYLIQTKRAPPETISEDKDQKTPHSAKRSLAFNDKEPQKKAISGQKLDYGEKENVESKNKMDDGREAVLSSEHKAGSIAGRTRSSCKKTNPDDAGENKVVLTKKACRKAKLSTSLHSSVQDSIARRLRPRINRT
ncbi:hypothetical protein V2J09_021765 [Rumex salicifolius]